MVVVVVVVIVVGVGVVVVILVLVRVLVLVVVVVVAKTCKGFQRVYQPFHVSNFKARHSRGKAQSRTRSRGVILERLENTGFQAIEVGVAFLSDLL